ncbi:MAG: helix-turn-helix domain-containing protein [Thermoleophilia bacterium]|nr:helix-turn-helix domain-containing protein [Thermoleophilia bacterium]
MDNRQPRRGLATARSVLHVLAHLEAHPEGVKADEVAHVAGKSASTAYYLLASLVEEGFATHDGGLYRPRRVPQEHPAADARHQLEDAVDDLFLRTHKRCYLGVVRRGGIEITVVRGRQGIARMPGLGTRITDNAHALAMGKVVLARLRPDAVARYAARGMPAYTPGTITTLAGLRAELDRVREHGYAVDREEFDEDFCCVAAPVTGERGELRGIVGLSATTRAFDAEHDQLAAAVVGVAAEASALEAVA